MKCAGCGTDIGPGPVTEVWHEFCGGCNSSYYREQAETEEVLQHQRWNSLVNRVGEEAAAEIWADAYGR